MCRVNYVRWSVLVPAGSTAVDWRYADAPVGGSIQHPEGPSMPVRAVAYVFSARHATEQDADRQRHQAAAFAEREGWQLVATFTDDGATRGRAFAAMTAALARGGAQRVIVPEDRHLHRSTGSSPWLVRHLLNSHFGVTVQSMHEPASAIPSRPTAGAAS